MSKFQESNQQKPSFTISGIARLSNADGDLLVTRFTLVEIKLAVWDCGNDKSPGPDGFTVGFIKEYWDLLANDFKEVMDRFFTHGRISYGCASSFIALIPKSDDPQSFEDRRPISLIGIIYKVITKILANRLSKVIGSVISDNQSAFIKDRNILEGPLILAETIAWLKHSKKKAMILKLDIQKPFNCVNRKFLISVMEQMGFPPRWCIWIKACLQSSRASVLSNGVPTAEFQCQRRQGDPLSPFLFTIAMEPLSCMLVKAASMGIFQGIQCQDGGPILTHLLYADDVLIMGEWSIKNR